MEEYCEENNFELLHIRQISKSEAHLEAFHCVFMFDEKKVELADFWPENVTVSGFYLNEAACDWLKSESKLTTSQSSIETKIDETKIYTTKQLST